MPKNNIPLDLDAMSKAELEALKRQLEEAMSKAEVRRREDAIRAARQSVEKFGFSLEEILALASRTGRGTGSRSRSGRTVRFRNPENPEETWSGRGRRPAWLTRHLEAGKSLGDLRA